MRVRARHERSLGGPQTEAIPRRACSLVSYPPPQAGSARGGATPDPVRQRGGLSSSEGAGEPRGGLGSCTSGRTSPPSGRDRLPGVAQAVTRSQLSLTGFRSDSAFAPLRDSLPDSQMKLRCLQQSTWCGDS